MAGETPNAPELAWEARPERGHLAGQAVIEGGPQSWLDYLRVELLGPGSSTRTLRTDSTGFFGAADLEPGIYIAQRYADETLAASSEPLRAWSRSRFLLRARTGG